MPLATRSGGLLLFFLLHASPLLGQDPEGVPTPESVQALTHELAEAWVRLEADAYLSFFAEDLVFYFDGISVSRADFEAVVRETLQALEASTFEITDPHIQILGDDAAVISFHLREVMVLDAHRSEDFQAAMSMVWARRSGGWKVVLMHESMPSPRGEGGDGRLVVP